VLKTYINDIPCT